MTSRSARCWWAPTASRSPRTATGWPAGTAPGTGELALAQWATAHLSPAERAGATVYTSGEHCPMCAAAHAWVGLGRIVCASSSEQLEQRLTELGAPAPPVRTLPVTAVAPDVAVEGPVPELADQVRRLHVRLHERGTLAGQHWQAPPP